MHSAVPKVRAHIAALPGERIQGQGREEGYFLLDLHLQRLAESAEYFDFPLKLADVKERLTSVSKEFVDLTKVRLLVSKKEKVTIQTFPLKAASSHRPLKVRLAVEPVSPDNIWLFHKTTHRKVYEDARAARPEADEVILWNEAGELTEGTVSNIVLDLGGRLVTPPLTCGLLNGTFRRYLLQNAQIQEERVFVEDLHRCRKVHLINSVRLWQEAKYIEIDSQK